MFVCGVSLLVWSLFTGAAHAVESFCPTGSTPNPAVIWCDDFEDSTPLANKYFEFDDHSGDFARVNSDSAHGQYSLRAHWQAGQVDAGHLIYTFGRNPIGTQSHSTQDFGEIYWRYYMKLQSGFVGYPDKNSRATAFAGTNWQQAMIAHLWVADTERDLLQIDPASGINANNQLATTTYNDFPHLTWLGARPGVTRLVAGQWYCIEAHAKLNASGAANGIHEFWINGNLEASRSDLNWIGNWTGYGINAVLLEAYWNAGSPATQERYFDDFVISTQRIGCTAAAPPTAPTGLTVQ